jgi:hypothetical protein
VEVEGDVGAEPDGGALSLLVLGLTSGEVKVKPNPNGVGQELSDPTFHLSWHFDNLIHSLLVISIGRRFLGSEEPGCDP